MIASAQSPSTEPFLPQSEGIVLDFDRRMRAKLASSLTHIFDRTAQALGIEDWELGPLISEIVAHRQAPSVFATYFELVFALKANRLDEAARLWRRISAAVVDTPTLEVVPLTAEALGEDAARFARLLNAGEKGAIFGPPDVAQWPAFATGVADAFSLLEQIDAALAAEIRSLIVLVIGSAPLSPALSFGGVSFAHPLGRGHPEYRSSSNAVGDRSRDWSTRGRMPYCSAMRSASGWSAIPIRSASPRPCAPIRDRWTVSFMQPSSARGCVCCIIVCSSAAP